MHNDDDDKHVAFILSLSVFSQYFLAINGSFFLSSMKSCTFLCIVEDSGVLCFWRTSAIDVQ